MLHRTQIGFKEKEEPHFPQYLASNLFLYSQAMQTLAFCSFTSVLVTFVKMPSLWQWA